MEPAELEALQQVPCLAGASFYFSLLRGGFKLQDDPGFQFCLDEPQIIGFLREKSVFELAVADKLKILSCMVNQVGQ